MIMLLLDIILILLMLGFIISVMTHVYKKRKKGKTLFIISNNEIIIGKFSIFLTALMLLFSIIQLIYDFNFTNLLETALFTAGLIYGIDITNEDRITEYGIISRGNIWRWDDIKNAKWIKNGDITVLKLTVENKFVFFKYKKIVKIDIYDNEKISVNEIIRHHTICIDN